MKIGKFQVTQYKSHAGRKGRYRHTEGHPAQAGSMTGRCQVAGPEYCAKACWQNITGKDYNVLKTRNRTHGLCEKFKQLGMAGTKGK